MESQNTLFTSAAKLHDDSRTNSTLFPSAKNMPFARTAANQRDVNNDFDWLENKSFTTDTAKKLVEFQEEFKLLQTEERIKAVKDGDSGGKAAESGPVTTDRSDNQHEDRHHYQKQEHNSEAQRPYDRDSSFEDSSRKDKKRKKKRRYDSNSDSDISDRGKRKKSKHHKHKKSHKNEKETKNKKYDTSAHVQNSKKIFLEEVDDSSYRLDKAGDRNSWTYGSLYKLHVPNYKCYLYGWLGSNKRYVDIQHKNRRKKTASDRYFGKDNRGIVNRLAERIVSDLQNTDISEEETKPSSYIEIATKEILTGKGKTDVRQEILDKSTQLYIQGKGVIETKTEEEIPLDPRLIKVAEYNRKLRQTPQNIQLWLEFVKFQDTFTDSCDTPVEGLGTDIEIKYKLRNTTDKKLSIFDKALESNPGNIDLQLAKLDLCSDIWDSFKINKELEQLLFVHPANLKLWQQYLTFNQSRLAVFSVSKVTKLYHKCFRTMTSVLEGRLQTHTVPTDLHEDVTSLFIQYCYFLKQSGHREKCATTLQAMIEYNILCPSQLGSVSNEIKMAEFEKFWESSGGKIGTKSGRGWRNWTSGNGEMEDIVTGREEEDLEELEQTVIEKAEQKWETWLEIETLRENYHWFPWQPDVSKGQTEEDCEDIERIVLFDDISPAVFTVPQHLHCDLVLTLLDLLGLKYVAKFKTTLTIENSFDISSSIESSVCAKHKEISNDVLDFAIRLLHSIIGSFQGKQKLSLTLALIEIQLQRFYQQKNLSKNDKKDMRKIVKNVLKDAENRNNLFIWVAYIDLEKAIGKVGEAQTVAETALTMYSGVSIQEVDERVTGLISLCGQYCEILLGMKSKSPDALWERRSPVTSEVKMVIHVLHCLIEGKKFSAGARESLPSTAVLKDTSRYSKLIESLCEELDSSIGCQLDMICSKLQGLCWCYFIFVYCTKDLQASLSVCDHVLTVIQGKGDSVKLRDLEQEIFTFQLRLVLYHMSTASVSLSILRTCLDKALSRFPDNAVFLSLFIDVERKARISGRFNRYFETRSCSSTTPVAVVLAVLAQIKFLRELAAHQTSGSSSDEPGISSSALVYRTHMWLERCLSRSDLQHCPLLWRLYLQLEKEVGNMTRLKGIFYRAIQQCPWVKTMYMDAVSSLGSDQLQEVVDLMVEKELRVQIPIEELDILISP